MAHQRLVHAFDAALRLVGGARWARTRTRSRSSCCAPAFQRPPTPLHDATSCCWPMRSAPGRWLACGVRRREGKLCHVKLHRVVASPCTSQSRRGACRYPRKSKCGPAARARRGRETKPRPPKAARRVAKFLVLECRRGNRRIRGDRRTWLARGEAHIARRSHANCKSCS